MKISIQTLGSFGDVMPFISVAYYLKKAGLETSILAPKDYYKVINSYGIKAYAVPSFTFAQWDEEAERRGTLKSPYHFFRDWGDMIAPHISSVVKASMESAVDADLILANPVCVPAQMVAEYNNIPYVLNAHQSVISPTREHPCAMLWKPWQPDFFNRAGYGFVSVAQRVKEHALKKHRSSLGMRGVHNLGAARGQPSQNMVRLTSVSPFLIPKRPKDWKHYDHLTAYPSLLAMNNDFIPQQLKDFLCNGSPPVFVGLGSMDAEMHVQDLMTIVTELKRAGLRAILTETLASKLPEELLAGQYISGYVPHNQLFPQCLAILHHGGAGTLDTALRSGVPQIIMPRFLDQFWHGDRLWKGGVAPKPLKRGQVARSEIEAALSFVSSNEVQRHAKEVAISLREQNGAKDVATFVLSRI